MATEFSTFATTKYPTFGRGPYNDENPSASVTNSPFYWWFKFLQLNEEYDQALNGKKSKVDHQVVADFGKVRGVSFKEWWKTHAHLFAEPKSENKLYVANSSEQLPPFNSTDSVVLVVPLDWTNIGLKRRINKLIDKYVPKTDKDKKGVRVKSSEARYRLGRKWRSDALKHAYDIYLARQRSDQAVAAGGKKTTWADIAIDVRLRIADEGKRKPTKLNYEARRSLTIIAKRHHQRALAFINCAASNKFPI